MRLLFTLAFLFEVCLSVCRSVGLVWSASSAEFSIVHKTHLHRLQKKAVRVNSQMHLAIQSYPIYQSHFQLGAKRSPSRSVRRSYGRLFWILYFCIYLFDFISIFFPFLHTNFITLRILTHLLECIKMCVIYKKKEQKPNERNYKACVVTVVVVVGCCRCCSCKKQTLRSACIHVCLLRVVVTFYLFV